MSVLPVSAEAGVSTRKRLARRRAQVLASPRGPAQLTARERVERLCDAGTFFEPAPMRRGRAAAYGGRRVERDGDGVIAGVGRVDGRPVVVSSHDFTVAGGSIGSAFADSVVRAQRLAVDIGCPIVYLNDSGGARIHEGIEALHGCGRIFAENVRARKVVPQVSVIMGPCASAAAYSPALTDWTVMVRGTGQMFLTGPEVVRAATGEAVDPEDLGGALLHTKDSGVAHLDVADDVAACSAVRQLLSFLPSRSGGVLPVSSAVPPQLGPEVLSSLVPPSPSTPFNMRRALAAILDGGEELELMPRYGPSLLTGFARLDGVPVGIVASQPKRRGGILDARTAVKGARFVSFCGRFGVPVLTFLDVPGFLPGSAEERQGVITHGAELLAAYVDAAVPKLTVIVRKAYGGAYIAMG
ncbi:MAG: acyl-CoA carboxylase subunit beta, partial [Sciscionella sp.]